MVQTAAAALPAPRPWLAQSEEPRPRVLVVEDEEPIRRMLASLLESEGLEVREAADAEEAQRLVREGFGPDVVLLDIQLPGLSGVQLLEWLRREAELAQVIMSTGVRDLETVRYCLREGAFDYLLKPFDGEELEGTVRKALERGRQILGFRRQQADLETSVMEKGRELESTRDLALLAMARLAESRDRETGAHLERIAEYAVVLARALRSGPYARRVGDELLERLRRSAPLHDVGKVGVPDAVLLKEGPLTPDERKVMQDHTTIGGDTLRSVGAGTPDPRFLEMAVEIAYQHHERWDGAGYPNGLAGEEISLPARIVALVDAYDAITSVRPYKPAFEHREAVRRIVVDRGEHFDPVVVDAFLECHRELDGIRQVLANGQ